MHRRIGRTEESRFLQRFLVLSLASRQEIVRTLAQRSHNARVPTVVRDRPDSDRCAVRARALFDGVSATLVTDPWVLIEAGRIVEVGTGVPPAGVDVHEFGSATLLPGLIDTHVHLCLDASPDSVGALAARTDGESVVAMVRAARAHLAAGVTTVRDLGDRDHLSLGLRGRDDLPTIVCSGPPLTTPAGHCHFLGGGVEPTTAAVREAVRRHVGRGVDVIKVMASGGNLTPGTLPEQAQFPAEVIAALVDEAHRAGLAVTAHAHGTRAIAEALAAGVDGLEHVTFWSADGVDSPVDLMAELAARRVPIGLTAGMVPMPGMVPPPALVARLPAYTANTRRLHELGAVLVVGTDAGIAPPKPHGVLPHALPLAEFGMGPVESLCAATSVAAAAIGLGHRKGRLAPGHDADLIAVDGDPFTDPAALRRVTAVFTHGVRRDVGLTG